MIGRLGREQFQIFTVKSDAVCVPKIRVIALFTAARLKIYGACFFVNIPNTPNGPVAAGDLIFELTGRQIVEVKVTPAVAFGEPDKFVGRRQITPARRPLARFKLCRADLFVHVSDRTGCCIGNTKILFFVIA